MKKYLNKTMGCYRFKLLLLLVVMNSQSVYAAPAWQKTAFITNSFFEVALGFEHRPAQQKVRKWQQSIKVYVEHQVGDSQLHDELLNAHIKDLQQITKLDIRRVKSKQQANVQYYFTSQQKLPELVAKVSGKSALKHLKTSVCMATMRASKQGEISNAVVYIAVNQARMHAKLVACIVEELTQVLGLPRDSDQVFPSIFNDRSTNDLLTGLDIVLLKLLYHSNIKVGMGKAQLRPMLKNILRRWRDQGVLDRSTAESRSLALCQYMDC